MTKIKKLYGVGTGPGDPEFLTLKSVRVMKEASVIFGPNNRGQNMAINTAKEFIEGKKIVLIDFPMGNVTREDYKRAAEIIESEIPEGECGAFLTIGDPMVYSTFIYIVQEIEKKYKHIDIEIAPGIPSFIAAASQSKTCLTVKDDNFLLCDNFKEDLLNHVDSLAILKTNKNKEEILSALERNDFEYKYIKRATLEEEQILLDKHEILNNKDYISLILAKKIRE